MADAMPPVLKGSFFYGLKRRLQQAMGVLGLVCLVAIALGLSGCQEPPPPGLTVQVMRVASGQTIEIPDPSGQTALNQAVRLIGIKAPDPRQEPWGKQAQDFLVAQIQNQSVRLESDVAESEDCEPYRRLAYVWKDGVLLNEKLVEEGLAFVDVRSPNFKYEDRLKQAQEKARILGRGIWNPDQPMRQTPSEFRGQQEPATQMSPNPGVPGGTDGNCPDSA